MQTHATRVRVESAQQTWTIHHLTDTHIDAPDFAERELLQRIKEIEEDPAALWIGGGDYGSLILPGDRRFTGGSTAKEWREYLGRIPDLFLERATEMFWPIRHKCLGLGVGNHEATIGKNYHRGVGAELAARLGDQDLYLGDRGWMPITFEWHKQRVTLKFFQYHGWSAGRLKGRKALQAERDIGSWLADALFLGHDHQPYADLWYSQELVHTGRGGEWRVRDRPRAVLNGGSWEYGMDMPRSLHGMDVSHVPGQSWVEGKNFRPQPPISPKLQIHLWFKKPHVVWDFEVQLRGGTFEYCAA